MYISYSNFGKVKIKLSGLYVMQNLQTIYRQQKNVDRLNWLNRIIRTAMQIKFKMQILDEMKRRLVVLLSGFPKKISHAGLISLGNEHDRSQEKSAESVI